MANKFVFFSIKYKEQTHILFIGRNILRLSFESNDNTNFNFIESLHSVCTEIEILFYYIIINVYIYSMLCININTH